MIMQTTDPLTEVPISDFVGIILDGGDRADEAMYYLLQKRLYQQLKRRYDIFQHQLLDDFDDIINDFFFYLRDGKPHLYPSLRRIRNREAFAQWLLRTFRNYICMRADKEGPVICTGIDDNSLSISDTGISSCNTSDNFSSGNTYDNLSVPDSQSSSLLTDERKLSAASRLIAYAHQEMSPRDSFLLLRALLTMLNKRRALPNEEVAEALGMTDVSYRVTIHRVKDRLAQYRTRLLRGEPLDLDGQHRQMAQRINDNFLHLYPTLLSYYEQSIAALPPDHADAVNHLRQDHFVATGNLLHEPETPYTAKLSKTALWNMVERVIEG